MRASPRVRLAFLAAALALVAACSGSDAVRPKKLVVGVTPPVVNLTVGTSFTLTVDVDDELDQPVSAPVTWKSEDAAIASVSSDGSVTALKIGTTKVTATATATSRQRFSASATIIVSAAVTVSTVTVTPASPTVGVGSTVQLTATASDAAGATIGGQTFTWSTSNSTVATVSAAGLVSAKAAGTATITASAGGKSGTAALTVTASAPTVASVTVSPASPSANVGSTIQLSATAKDAGGNTISGQTYTWTSDNTGVATVSSSGFVSAKAAGTATISATTGGKSGTAAVTVTAPIVASVTVSPAAPSMAVGNTMGLTATAKDASGATISGQTFTWSSSNQTVATVSAAGVVSGKAAGTATITAATGGKSGTAAVTVTAVPPPPPGSVTFVGAGDIAGCGYTGDEATALLLDKIPGTVFTLGDNVYPDGTDQQYADCYNSNWGRHKARTRPTPGNHDYDNVANATGYFNYFGAAAEPSRGYYSYDIGEWHIVSLNSEISYAVGSPQEVWLRADLAATTKKCQIAMWHRPRWSSGHHGSASYMQPLWKALVDYGVEIALFGHDHLYERFAPQDANGNRDDAKGVRSFVVGTGGATRYAFNTPIANSEVRDNATFGVIKFTLSPNAYQWEFVPVAGATFTDSGSGTCH